MINHAHFYPFKVQRACSHRKVSGRQMPSCVVPSWVILVCGSCHRKPFPQGVRHWHHRKRRNGLELGPQHCWQEYLGVDSYSGKHYSLSTIQAILEMSFPQRTTRETCDLFVDSFPCQFTTCINRLWDYWIRSWWYWFFNKEDQNMFLFFPLSWKLGWRRPTKGICLPLKRISKKPWPVDTSKTSKPSAWRIF